MTPEEEPVEEENRFLRELAADMGMRFVWGLMGMIAALAAWAIWRPA